jgi:hypothetical protein
MTFFCSIYYTLLIYFYPIFKSSIAIFCLEIVFRFTATTNLMLIGFLVYKSFTVVLGTKLFIEFLYNVYLIYFSLWSIMKNCIGKDLSKIPVPVNFSEPLSMLQRLLEDFEYRSFIFLIICVLFNFISTSYVTFFFINFKGGGISCSYA